MGLRTGAYVATNANVSKVMQLNPTCAAIAVHSDCLRQRFFDDKPERQLVVEPDEMASRKEYACQNECRTRAEKARERICEKPAEENLFIERSHDADKHDEGNPLTWARVAIEGEVDGPSIDERKGKLAHPRDAVDAERPKEPVLEIPHRWLAHAERDEWNSDEPREQNCEEHERARAGRGLGNESALGPAQAQWP
jgi:hypothetical protein